jgi:DNA-directed RNA polymerase specialized sigma subunit
MKKIRRNSSLTLKEIGELFGGISESRVSRILGKAN